MHCKQMAKSVSYVVNFSVGIRLPDQGHHLALQKLHFWRVNNRWYLRWVEGNLAKVLGYLRILPSATKSQKYAATTTITIRYAKKIKMACS